MVNKSYPNTNNRVMQTMLIFTIAISFEIKAGKITKDKFVDINNNEEYKAILVSSRVLMDNRQFYIREFDNNYYYNFKTDYRFFKFIEYYVRTRIFDMKIFKDDMEVILNTGGLGKIPAYKRLLTEEYWKIADDEFNGVISEIIDNVRKGELELVDLVKIYAYFCYFSQKKLISYDIPTLKSLFISGMNISSTHSKYCEDVQKELSKIAIEGMEHDMEEIMNKFLELNGQLKDKMLKEKADEIFKCIPMRMEKFYDRFDKECMDIPIFKYEDPYQVFQRISCASNEDIMMIKDKMINRVNLYTEQIKEETENIKKLKQIMEEYSNGKEISIKTVILKGFAKDLEYIVEKLEK